jgi:CheY-like chemotaxis protein
MPWTRAPLQVGNAAFQPLFGFTLLLGDIQAKLLVTNKIQRAGMTNSPAQGALSSRRVLVVEDEYFLADDMALELQKGGAEVVGPVPTMDQALAVLASDQRIDAAVLDINLKGENVFQVADALARRGVPFVFATGYGPSIVPPEHSAVPRFEKPLNLQDLARMLPGLLSGR